MSGVSIILNECSKSILVGSFDELRVQLLRENRYYFAAAGAGAFTDDDADVDDDDDVL